MESSQSGAPTQVRKFVGSFTFGYEGSTLEDANEKVQRLLEHAEEMGLQLIDGGLSNSRERDPVESISYASDGIWRNKMAEDGHWFPHVEATRMTDASKTPGEAVGTPGAATPAGATS